MLIQKEELPIIKKNIFHVPIPSRLLSKEITIDSSIAHRVFPQATIEWYNDLKDYVNKTEDNKERDWIKKVFLKEKPKIISHFDRQNIKHLNWEDNTGYFDNGFADYLSINRNSGGTLYFNINEINCWNRNPIIGNKLINFSEEKLKEFSKEDKLYLYAQHNIDTYPGALFLRNWAILYINQAIRELQKS